MADQTLADPLLQIWVQILLTRENPKPLVIGLTDDARLVALVTVFRFVPFVLVGLPAGVLLDRFDRRRIAVLAVKPEAA